MVSKTRIPRKHWEWNGKGFPLLIRFKERRVRVYRVVTYHPLLKQLEGILRWNKYLLNMNAEVTQMFTPIPMVSCRSSGKLSNYLVRAKIYLIDRIVGSKGYGKKQCEVCVNVCETNTFSSTAFLRASAVDNNMLQKPLGSLGLGGTIINGNIQVSLKMSR